MAGMLPVPRSRGALSGTLLVLLGAWGALIPFIGPYFRFAYTPDTAWTYTSGRMWLEVLPGAAALLGGLIVLASRSRPTAVAGAWLAALSGAWFAAGAVLSPLWVKGSALATGTPVGTTTARVLEQIGFFTGLGLVIVFLAALALGRFMVVGVREAKRAEISKAEAAQAEAAQAEAAQAEAAQAEAAQARQAEISKAEASKAEASAEASKVEASAEASKVEASSEDTADAEGDPAKVTVAS